MWSLKHKKMKLGTVQLVMNAFKHSRFFSQRKTQHFNRSNFNSPCGSRCCWPSPQPASPSWGPPPSCTARGRRPRCGGSPSVGATWRTSCWRSKNIKSTFFGVISVISLVKWRKYVYRRQCAEFVKAFGGKRLKNCWQFFSLYSFECFQ